MPGSTIVSQPSVTIALSGAQQAISNAPQKVLIVGLLDTSGTAIAAALTENVPADTASINALFGAQSWVAMMCRNFRKTNQVTMLDVIGLTPAGAAATGDVTVVGTATENGTLTVEIGSKDDFSFDITVTNTDTATTIGDAIALAINTSAALTTTAAVPVAAVNTAGAVAITADEAGLQGNDISLKISGTIAGITHSVGLMTGGTGDPSSSSTLDVIAGERYQTMASPSSWDITNITDVLDARFNVDNDILDGVAIFSNVDSLANILTLNNALNSQSINTLNFNIVADTSYAGNSMLEFTDGISSQVAGIRSLRLTDDALITDILVGQTGLDSFGGTALASRPYHNTPLSDLPIIELDRGWSAVEVGQINDAGGSTIGSNRQRTGSILDAMFTTYKTDSAGNPDLTFEFLNGVDTSVNAREFFFNNIKSDFAQMRLTAGELVENRPMANESLIRARLMGYYRDISEQDFTLTVKGSAAEKVFNDNMTITIDFQAGQVTVIFALVPLVSQFRDFNGDFNVTFGL